MSHRMSYGGVLRSILHFIAKSFKSDPIYHMHYLNWRIDTYKIELQGELSLYNDLDSNIYIIYLITIVTYDFISTSSI